MTDAGREASDPKEDAREMLQRHREAARPWEGQPLGKPSDDDAERLLRLRENLGGGEPAPGSREELAEALRKHRDAT